MYYFIFVNEYLRICAIVHFMVLEKDVIITWSDFTAVFVEPRNSLRFVYIDYSLTLTIYLGARLKQIC